MNAVRGYLDMVSRVLADRRPQAVVNTFDADWRPQWRVDLYPGYKAKRGRGPAGAPSQVPLLLEVLDAAGLPVAEAAGYEADDVIGTIAAAAGPEERVAVLTGDRDLFQVVRDPTVDRVLYPLKGTSQLATMDAAGVAAKTRVPPSATPTWPSCAATPPTACPGCPGSARRPPPPWSPTTPTWTPCWPRPPQAASRPSSTAPSATAPTTSRPCARSSR